MGKVCIVPECKNYESDRVESNVGYRRIPKDPARRRKWIEILEKNGSRIGEENVKDDSRVCNDHFSPEKAKRARLSRSDLPHLTVDSGDGGTRNEASGCGNNEASGSGNNEAFGSGNNEQVALLTRRSLRRVAGNDGGLTEMEEQGCGDVEGHDSSNIDKPSDHGYARSRPTVAFQSGYGDKASCSSIARNSAPGEPCTSPDLFEASGDVQSTSADKSDNVEFTESQSTNQTSEKSIADDPLYVYESPPSDELLEKFYYHRDPELPKQGVLTPKEGRNYIIREQQLRLLMRYCPNCGGKCSSHVVAVGYGVDAEFSLSCEHCRLVQWKTQPTLEGVDIKKGNLDLAGAIFLSGGTYEDVRPIARHMNVEIMSEATYYRYTNEFVYPSVEQTFSVHQTGILDGIRHQQANDPTAAVSLSIDSRFSRPGYTASFCVTSAICLETGKIILHLVKAKTDDDVTSSPNMETEATKTILQALIAPTYADDATDEVMAGDESGDESGDEAATEPASEPANDEFCQILAPAGDEPIPIRVDLLVTDENAAVISMVRQKFPGLRHEADPWHLCKSVVKPVTKVAKKASCSSLAPWILSIRNWLWTAMKECKGDGDLLVEQWRSILYHIVGQHDWADDDTFLLYKACCHPDMFVDAFGFLPPTSSAYTELAKIVKNPKVHKRLRRCTSFAQTSLTESFHCLLLKYTPKRLKFSSEGFRIRTKMAVMDWNENVGRPIKKTKTGADRIHFTYPASAGAWRAKRQYVDRTTSWSTGIMETLNNFACKRWLDGHTVSRSSHAVSTHRPLVSQYEKPDRIYLAAQLYR